MKVSDYEAQLDNLPEGPPEPVHRWWTRVDRILPVILAFILGAVVGFALVDDQQEELDAAIVRVGQLEDDVTASRATVARIEAERDDAAEDAAVLRSEIDTLEGRIAGYTDQIADLKKQVTHWKDQATADAAAGGYNVNAKTSFGDGVWRVGEEIQPGTYRAPGGGSCYWERLSGFSGSFGDIITNDFGTSNTTVTISSTDAGFSTDDCGTWEKI